MQAENKSYTDLIAEYKHFVHTLQLFEHEWLNNYFNLIKTLLNDLSLTNDSTQLAMSVTKDGNLHINVGQRWVSKPFYDGSIGLILPMEQKLAPVNCKIIGYYTNRRMREAQWVSFRFINALPTKLYSLLLTASKAEVERVKTKSGYRKFHSPLFYDAVMRPEARKELMYSAFK